MRLPFLILILMVSAFSAADTVNLVDGNLSVEFDDTDLRDALKAVGAKAEVNFVVSSSVDGKLSSKIKALPFEEAIKKLLYGYNYAVMYDDGSQSPRRINKVVILGAATNRGGGARPKSSASVEVKEGESDSVNSASDTGGEVVGDELVDEDDPDAEIVATKNKDGHYIVHGSINGRSVTFIVDQNASRVTLTAQLARNLGLVLASMDRKHSGGGQYGAGFDTVLTNVKVGGIERENVNAVVVARLDRGGWAILGRSFLQGLNLEILDDVAVISTNAEN